MKCCNQNCRQGRDCPARAQPKAEKPKSLLHWLLDWFGWLS